MDASKAYEILEQLDLSMSRLLESEDLGEVESFETPHRLMDPVEDAPLTEVEDLAIKILSKKYGIPEDVIFDEFVNKMYAGADTLGPYRDAEATSETIEEAIAKAAPEVAEGMESYDTFEELIENYGEFNEAVEDDVGNIDEFPKLSSSTFDYVIARIRNILSRVETFSDVDQAFDTLEREYPDIEYKQVDWKDEAEIESWADSLKNQGYTIIDNPICEGTDMIGYIAIPNEYLE